MQVCDQAQHDHLPFVHLPRENVDKRNGACSVIIDKKLYIWGGETEEILSDDEDSDSDEESGTTPITLPRPKDNYPFDVFDITTRMWGRQPTTAKDKSHIPLLGYGSTLHYHVPTHSIYLYGGWNKTHFDSEVYKLSADTWYWEKLVCESNIKPSPRYLTGALVYQDRLCNFGGVGPQITSGQDKDADYVQYSSHGRDYPFGWNNEYYEFDLNTREWDTPYSGTKKSRPPPVGAFVFTRFDKHRALYFGGRRESGYCNATYTFDLKNKLFGSEIKFSDSHVDPRTFATLSSLVDPDMVGEEIGSSGVVVQPRLFLLWGKKNEKVITTEGWMFDPVNIQWTQVDVSRFRSRAWHVGVPYYPPQPNTCTECDVFVFGGNAHIRGNTGDRENVADMKILSFGFKSLQNLCLSTILKCLEGKSKTDLEMNLLLPDNIKRNVLEAHSAQSNHHSYTCQFSSVRRS